MIATITRSTVAVLVALVAASILVVGVEGIGSVLHPFPPGVDPTDLEVCRAHVARYPTGGLLLGALGWGLTTFVSSWLATRLGTRRHPAHGIAVGSILLVLAVMNMAMLPYPVWFWIFNLVAFPVGCLWGAALARARASPAQEPAA